MAVFPYRCKVRIYNYSNEEMGIKDDRSWSNMIIDISEIYAVREEWDKEDFGKAVIHLKSGEQLLINETYKDFSDFWEQMMQKIEI